MSNLPAHLANRQRRDLAAIAVGGINSGSPAHISIAGNRFTLVDEAGNEKPIQTLFLDVCVIDANAAVSKIFFDPRIPFVPGGDNSNPPICWSDNGIGASANAPQPQNALCQLCPHNEWGSKINLQTNTKSRACNDVKKVAATVAGIEMAFLLRIPPASLKNWGKYCNTLAGHGVDLPDVLTRVEFESQGILKFSPSPAGFENTSFVDPALGAIGDRMLAAKATDILLGHHDRPWSGQGDAAKVAYAERQQTPQIAPSAPAPAPMAPPPQPFGGQQVTQAPFGVTHAPSAGAFGQTPLMPVPPAETRSPSDPFGGQPGISSPPAATPAKRTRGPNKVKDQNSTQADDGIPPFLQRDQAPAAPPPANPTQFGMQAAPAAPDAGVQAALDAAFRLPS